MSYQKMVLLPIDVYNNIVNSSIPPSPVVIPTDVPKNKAVTTTSNPATPSSSKARLRPIVQQRGGSKPYKRDNDMLRRLLRKLTKRQLKSVLK